jgi:hypothetical protein
LTRALDNFATPIPARIKVKVPPLPAQILRNRLQKKAGAKRTAMPSVGDSERRQR